MACTEAEWLQWLPAAIGEHRYEIKDHTVRVTLGSGELYLQWQVQPPRAIALIRLPRLLVRFEFSGVSEHRRHTFMRRFDLYLQRGGG